MLKVCVIFGGASNEHEISLLSATSILNNLDKEKYEVVMVGITKKGNWYLYEGPVQLIASGRWEKSPFIQPAIFSPDPQHGGLLILGEKRVPSQQLRNKLLGDLKSVVSEKSRVGLRTVSVDIVFPVLHGKNGEDGTVQGLFELAEVPYVGCGVLASAACMDKAVAHEIMEKAGVYKTKLVTVYPHELEEFEWLKEKLGEELGYPMFVKPANAGSSIGVSKVKEQSALRSALKLAFKHDSKVVVEKAVVGREIECAVWGNENPNASYALGEIVVGRELYDYKSKYTDNTAQLIAPAELSEEKNEEIRNIAVKAYLAMGCRGLSRVDFFVEEAGTVVLNEINTMPGFTSISMFPKLFNIDGLTTPELLDNLIDSALNFGMMNELC